MAFASPLSFTGTVSYNDSSNDDSTTQVSQNTTATFDQELTPVMKLEESVRYRTSWQGGKNAESLAPILDFSVDNHLFLFEFSGAATKQRSSEQSNRLNRSWLTRLNSNWEKPLWPVIQLNFGQDFSEDDQDPKVTDSVSTLSGFDIDWDLLLANVYYSVDRNENEDETDKSSDTNTRQLARFSTDKYFWEDRIRFSFLEQYTQNDQTHSSIVSEDGFTLVPVTVILSKGGWDPDDEDAQPEWDDLVTPLPTVLQDERYNIAIRVDSQQVDTIYLETDVDLTSEANLFRWELYYSSNGTDWTISIPTPTASYNMDLQRFEIEIPGITARYIMLVETDVPSTEDFNITQIRTFKKVTGAIGTEVNERQESYDYITEAGLSWRIASDLNITYNFGMKTGKTVADEDTDSRNQSLGLRWTPSLLFTSTFTANETQEQQGDEEESLSRAYAASFFWEAFPTLDFNLAVTRSEKYEDNSHISTNYDYTLLTNATLFPDLTTTLDLAYGTDSDKEKNEYSQDFNVNWKVTARLIPGLTLDFTERYSTSRAEETDSWTFSSGLDLSWRFSDILSMSAAGSQLWDDVETGPFLYNLNFSLSPANNTQVSLNYNHDDESDMYSANWSWTINKYYSTRINCSYSDKVDDDELQYGAQMSVRY
ncbi:MAG: hypothetical protein KQH63_17360 [Desulfobulbaceae bacterium]|nr:hypothetical protein [Desulfobulbaceae bacterium]